MTSDPPLEHLKQNSPPMNLPPQLLTPCAWTIHMLEGGLACLPWLLELGGGRSNPRASIPLSREPLPKNPAQAPRSAKPNPLSGDQTPSNRINYFQTPSGPLRFFSTGRVQRPQQPVRGAVMLVRKTCSMGFWHAAALHKAAFDRVMSGKL